MTEHPPPAARQNLVVTALVILAVVLAGYLLVPRPPVTEDGSTIEGRGGGPAAQPSLRGAQDGVTTVPVELRGTSHIVGRVERDGAPVACTVTLHLVQRIADRDPLEVWRRAGFSERVFGGGLAATPHIATRRTGEDGRFTFAGLGLGEFEVRALVPGGIAVRAGVELHFPDGSAEVVLHLPGGGETLVGTVLLEDGSPFRGSVIVQPDGAAEDPEPFADGAVVVTTSEGGGFEVPALLPGAYEVVALRPGHFRTRVGVVRLPAAEPAVLTLSKARRLHGRVLDDETSRPISGASLIASSEVRMGTAATDAEGRFEVDVGPGAVSVLVEATEHALVRTHWRVLPDGPVEFRLLRSSRVVGTVKKRGTGESVAGVWIYALPHSGWGGSGGLPSAVRTDADGRYELLGVHPGIVTVAALGAGWCSTEITKIDARDERQLRRDIQPGETVSIDLEVVPSARLEGEVVSATGVPVPGAVLQFHGSVPCGGGMGLLGMVGWGLYETATDADGRFVVETLPPDQRHSLTVEAAGYPRWMGKAEGEVAPIPSGEARKLTVRLDAPHWLDVLVRSADGTPLPGAQVELSVQRERSWNPRSLWTTGADGRVRAGPLHPGGIEVRASAPSHYDGEVEVDAADTPGDPRTVEVVLQTGSFLAGRVLTPPGVPTHEAYLDVMADATSDHEAIERRLSVTPEGRWRVDGIPYTTYALRVSFFYRGRSYQGAATAHAGQVDVEIEVTTGDPEPRELVVHVLDPAGQAVGSALIAWHPSNLVHGIPCDGGRAAFDILEGHGPLWFEVWGAPADRCGGTVLGPIADIGKELTIRLPPPRTIEGTVLGAEGKPLQGLAVRACMLGDHGDVWNEHATTTTDQEGRFTLRGLCDRVYQVYVETPLEYASPEPQKLRGGAEDIVVDLGARSIIQVRIIDPNGKPIERARVSATHWSGMLIETYEEARAVTDADGVARLQGLNPLRRYTLTIRLHEPRDDVSDLTIENWAPLSGTIQLERHLQIAGRVVDPSGRPAPYAAIRYRPARGGSRLWRRAACDKEGRFRLEALKEGVYEVAADAGHRTSPPRHVELVAAGESNVLLEVERGVTLTVHVSDWPRGLDMFATLTAEDEDPPLVAHQRRVGPGELSFDGLDADRTYALRVECRGSKIDQYVLAAGLRPGPTLQRLDTLTGGHIRGRVLHPSSIEIKHGFAEVRVGVFTVQAQMSPNGTFVIRALPTGHHTVTVRCTDTLDTAWTTSVEAATGEEVEVELTAR